MASHRISIRIPQHLGDRLRNHSRLKGQSESELVRQALERYLGQSTKGQSAYELAEQAGVIGVVKRAPKDLSSNRRHLEGFGEK